MGQTGVEGINKLTMKFMKKNKRNTKKLQGPDVPSNRITQTLQDSDYKFSESKDKSVRRYHDGRRL